MTLRGIDVSRANLPSKDPFAGVDFIAVRAMSGTTPDTFAAEHLRRAREQVLAVKIVYGYLHTHVDSVPAAEQARALIARAAELATPGEDLALAVDVEPVDWTHPDAPTRVADMLLDWARTVVAEGGGRAPLAYLPLSYARTLYDHAPEAMIAVAALCLAWCADWQPPWDVPPPWKRTTILQTGPQAGVDRDEYDGTAEEMRAELGLAPIAWVLGGASPLAG